MNQRAAVVQDGRVVNVVVLSLDSRWRPPAGTIVPVPDDATVSPGWTHTPKGGFAPPPPDPDAPPVPQAVKAPSLADVVESLSEASSFEDMKARLADHRGKLDAAREAAEARAVARHRELGKLTGRA